MTAGRFRRSQKLEDAEIVARYKAGESQGLLGLRAGIADKRIREILLAAGVTLRTPAEAVRLGQANSYKKRRPGRS